jgi:hypothetical protein
LPPWRWLTGHSACRSDADRNLLTTLNRLPAWEP